MNDPQTFDNDDRVTIYAFPKKNLYIDYYEWEI